MALLHYCSVTRMSGKDYDLGLRSTERIGDSPYVEP